MVRKFFRWIFEPRNTVGEVPPKPRPVQKPWWKDTRSDESRSEYRADRTVTDHLPTIGPTIPRDLGKYYKAQIDHDLNVESKRPAVLNEAEITAYNTLTESTVFRGVQDLTGPQVEILQKVASFNWSRQAMVYWKDRFGLEERKLKQHQEGIVYAPGGSQPNPEASPRVSTKELTLLERETLAKIAGGVIPTLITGSQLEVVRQLSGVDWTRWTEPGFRSQNPLNNSSSWNKKPDQSQDPWKFQSSTGGNQGTFNKGPNPQSAIGRSGHRYGFRPRVSTTADTRTEKHATLNLNAEQQRVFDFIENSGQNVFVTGRAGSGKSYLLRYLLENSSSRCLPVAFMGIAALNIGGSTIHSAFGLPLELLLPSTGKNRAERLSEESRAFYREYRMLVVDEVSMVAADQFVAMDRFLRVINENDKPFGGIQVILFGDPYQLPPVVVQRVESEFYADNWGNPFFFSTDSWKEDGFYKVELQGSERQAESEFLRILDAMRVGQMSDDDWKIIQSRVTREPDLPKTGAVRVSSTNSAADSYNDLRLRELPGTPYLYVGKATGEYRKNWKRLPAPMRLYLKEDAQVIMVKNDIGRRWVNGSVGKVTSVSATSVRVAIEGLEHPVEEVVWDKETHTYDRARKLLESESYSTYRQLPISLGWARTIHKAQGQTFDKCVVDTGSDMFEKGQAYVALSRTKSLDGLFLTAPLEPKSVLTSDTIRQFMSDLMPVDNLPPF